MTFGLAAFRAAIRRSLELAELAESLVREHAELTLMAPATLGIVCFRREWPGTHEAETERLGLALVDALERGGTALVSTTRLAGRHAVRLCILNPTSSAGDVRRVIEHFAARRTRLARRHGAVRADSRAAVIADPDGTCCAPCPCSPACPTRRSSGRPRPGRGPSRHRRGRGGHPPVGLRPVLLHHPLRPVRRGHRQPPDPCPRPRRPLRRARRPRLGRRLRLHPARHRPCAEPGRLLRLSSGDFQWLTETAPAVGDRLATIAAERLQQR